ncbi:methionyl-tRNA formyltransferase [Pedobacter sp.]|nr:methionyl-tRNA formyltransferase [Candidatus Saccharibacteria bacterium]
MTSSKTVVFFGTEQFSAPTLQSLIAAGYPIAYVVTKPDTARGRGRTLESPEVKKIAQVHGIPVLQPLKLKDIYDTLAALENSVGVLVSYGKIIPQSIIELFTPGIINVHPSLLPKYRGPSPIESAILNGDQETGISIMQLSAAMDAGSVYTQITIPLTGTETKSELYSTFAQRGADILIENLPHILDESLTGTSQYEADATYCSLLKKDDGAMNTEHKTAQQLEREVRAYLGFPKSRLAFHGQPLIVLSAHIGASIDDGPLTIACLDQSYLVIDELIAPSGKKMNAEAFIRGHQK